MTFREVSSNRRKFTKLLKKYARTLLKLQKTEDEQYREVLKRLQGEIEEAEVKWKSSSNELEASLLPKNKQ